MSTPTLNRALRLIEFRADPEGGGFAAGPHRITGIGPNQVLSLLYGSPPSSSKKRSGWPRPDPGIWRTTLRTWICMPA